MRETGSGGRPGRRSGPVPELPDAPALHLWVVRGGAARARDRCRYRSPVLDLLPPASYRPVRTLRAGHCQTAVQLRDRPGDLLPLLATAIRHLPQLRGAQGVRARRSIRWPDLRHLPWPSPTAESLRVLRSTEAAAIDPGSGPDLRTMLRHSAPAPGRCAHCNHSRPLVGADAQGARVCGPCSGDGRDHACRQCGRIALLHADRRCPTCIITERVTNLLTGSEGATGCGRRRRWARSCARSRSGTCSSSTPSTRGSSPGSPGRCRGCWPVPRPPM